MDEDAARVRRRETVWGLATTIVLGAGLALRLALIRELALTPVWFVNFLDGLDTFTHLESARRILSDFAQAASGAAYYQSPLYPHVLAGLQTLCGTDPVSLAYAQAVISALTAWVVCRLAARLFGPEAGVAAACVASFLIQSVFYPLYFLSATVEAFCAALSLATAAAAFDAPEGRRAPWIWAGLAIGLGFLARPNIAVATLVTLAAALARSRRPPGSRVLIAMTLVTGIALMLAPLVVRNVLVAGQVGLLPASGAENFRIGNSQDSLVAGFGYPRQPPLPLFSLAMLKHQVAKFFVFFGRWEIPQNVNMQLVRESSELLSLPLLQMHTLVALAVLGLVAGRRRGAVQACALWTVVYAASISAFFVVGRFRLPAVPALVLLAVAGAGEVADRLSARAHASVAAHLLVFGLICWAAGRMPEKPIRVNDYIIALDANWTRGRPGALETIAARAVRDYPADPTMRALHAATLVDRKSPAAAAELEAALKLDPESPRALIALLAFHATMTKDAKAIAGVQAHLRALGIQVPKAKSNETPPGSR